MDAYRDVALGVESAWPAITVREAKDRSRRTPARLAPILAAVLAAVALVFLS